MRQARGTSIVSILLVSIISFEAAIAVPQGMPPYSSWAMAHGNPAAGQRSICPNLPRARQGMQSQRDTPWPQGPPPKPDQLPVILNNLPQSSPLWHKYDDMLPPPAGYKTLKRTPLLIPRRNDHSNSRLVYCVPTTFVTLTITFLGETMQPMLVSRWIPFIMRTAWVVDQLAIRGDGVISQDAGNDEIIYPFSGQSGQRMYAYNDDDHQLTYGVLAAALAGLEELWLTGTTQLMDITIQDGANVVGRLLMGQEG